MAINIETSKFKGFGSLLHTETDIRRWMKQENMVYL